MLSEQLSKQIITTAKEQFGFSLVGIHGATPVDSFPRFVEWIESGMSADMDWMHSEGRMQKRANVAEVLPRAKTVITLAYSYYTQDLPPEILQDPSRGIFARYSWGSDYHKVLKKRLIALIHEIVPNIEMELGAVVNAKAYVDTGPILERDLAERAGLGFIGKNSLLINKAYGSYLFLSEIIIDAELAPVSASRKMQEREWSNQINPVLQAKPVVKPKKIASRCGACTRCIDACPTNAIIRPGVVDARRCISYHTIENRSIIPEYIRPLMGNRIYGCDICQEVCPWNSTKKSKSLQSDWLEADIETMAPKLADLAVLTEEAFFERFKGTPIMRTRRTGLLRNVAIALGNWKSAEALPALQFLGEDDDEIIREHALWAIKYVQS